MTPIFALLHLKSGLKPDPQSLATGGFVGAVRGNVHISDCRIVELSGVSNVNNWTGGFVGYSTGITKYEDITQLLGGVVGGLSQLLNLIPFLGLGDLLTALINGGALKVGDLIPIGYVNPIYQNCSVSFTQGAAVNGNGKQYVGGFAGETIGTLMQNCTIENVDTVSGSNYVGGFIGRSANAVIAGLLSNLGVDLLDNFPVNTILMNCGADGVGQVLASPVKDESGYAGGFIGAMSNSYAVDCTLGIIFRHFRIYFFCIPAFQQIQPDFSPLHLIGLTISFCLKMQKRNRCRMFHQFDNRTGVRIGRHQQHTSCRARDSSCNEAAQVADVSTHHIRIVLCQSGKLFFQGCPNTFFDLYDI